MKAIQKVIENGVQHDVSVDYLKKGAVTPKRAKTPTNDRAIDLGKLLNDYEEELDRIKSNVVVNRKRPESTNLTIEEKCTTKFVRSKQGKRIYTQIKPNTPASFVIAKQQEIIKEKE